MGAIYECRPVIENGKLAYNSVNAPLHAYVDSLEKLQVALDEVDSAGNKVIREQRREMVLAIEKELDRIEKWKQRMCGASDSAAHARTARNVPMSDVKPETHDIVPTNPEGTPQFSSAPASVKADGAFATSVNPSVLVELLETSSQPEPATRATDVSVKKPTLPPESLELADGRPPRSATTPTGTTDDGWEALDRPGDDFVVL